MDPVTLAAISGGLMAVGTAVSVKGALDQASYRQKLAQQNAQVARDNSLAAINRGDAEAEMKTIEGGQITGRQRAAAGASGVDVQSGSVLDVLSGTRFMNSMDVSRIKYNAGLQARGYNVQAENFEAEGTMAELEGAYGAAGSLLTGASNVAGIAYKGIPKFT